MNDLFDVLGEHPRIQWFRKFHKENPHYYIQFADLALEAAGKRDYFSGQTIAEHMRWKSTIQGNDPDFKVNDHVVAFYTRMFMAEFIQYAGSETKQPFFQLRKANADDLSHEQLIELIDESRQCWERGEIP